MIGQFAVCDASLHGLVAKGPCSHPVGSPTFFPPTRWWGKVRVVFEGSDWRWEKEKDLVKRRVDPEPVRSITFFWGRGVRKPRHFVGHWTSSILNRKLPFIYSTPLPCYSSPLSSLSSHHPFFSHCRPCFCVLSKESHSEDTLIDCTFHCQLSPPLLTRLRTAAVAAETLR